jgi:hypothetical protein
MDETSNNNIDALKAPITKYGIYVAIVITSITFGLLCFLKLDHKPIIESLLHYYIK